MIQLAPYQTKAEEWLRKNPFTILGDEPGVGKTHPAIFAAQQQGPNLIICPAYLATNWKHELERCGETDIVVIVGSAKVKKLLLQQNYKWTIMSYALLARSEYEKILQQCAWASLIFDEAHRLRGRNSLRTKAAYRLRKRTDRIWMLTGTPLVANAGDLFPLLKLCDPQEYSSYWRFVGEHCHLTQTPWATKIGKLKNEAVFYDLLRKHMLRRKLVDMLPDIPKVVEQKITVELTGINRTRYQRAKKEYRLDDKPLLSGGAMITALRQLTSSDGTKIKALDGLISDLPEEKIVIFAWYRSTVHKIVEKLQENYKGIYCVTGATPWKARQNKIDLFEQGGQKFLVATLGALREGVNLQCARIVIFVEEDWLAATNEQATARLLRRGQERTVLKYSIHARKTVDESVHRIQQRRADMSLQAVINEEFRE